jgi:hypothetical protein
MTSITDQTALMVAAIEGFKTVLPGALAAKAQEAEQADATNELQGQDFPTLSTSLDADLTSHVNNHNNPHGDTADAVGTYRTTDVDTKVKGIIPSASLPLSRYGSLSYLPPGVSGSFEGATMNFESRRYPGILENDGTFVFLRNGTTGSVMGVYYAYVKNASTGTLATPTRTNARYQPAYFPANTTARYVFKSDGNCILGRLQTSAGVLSDYFISLTSGTFDATKHVGAIIPAASFPALASGSVNIEAFVGNSNLYLVVTADPTNNANPVDFQLWSIPLSSIQTANGGNVSPTQITGWTTTGFGGTFSATTNIRVANKFASSTAFDLPIVVYDTTTSAGFDLFVDNDNDVNTDSAQDPSTGNIRIRVTGSSFSNTYSSGNTRVVPIAFWINVNPSAKTATLEGPATTPGAVTYSGTTQAYEFSGGMFPGTATGYLPGNYQGGGPTWVWAPSGYWFGIRDSDPPDYGANVYRATTNALYANRYAALAPSAGVNSNTNSGFTPMYGSALGGRMLGTWPLPGGYMMAASYGPKQDGTYEWGPVLIQPGASGYTYQSQYNGTLSGFAPSILRTRVTDMGLSIDTFTALVSEISAAGAVTTSGGRFLDGYNTVGPVSVTVSGNVLQSSGAVVMPTSVPANLKAAAWSLLGVATPPASNIEIIIPQNTAIPPFGLLTWTDSSKRLWVCLLELSITSGSRTGTINSMSIISNSSAQQTNTGTTIQPVNASILYTGGSCCIYEGSDAYFVGFLSKVYLIIPGTGATHNIRFAIPKSTNRPDWSTRNVQVQGGSYSTSHYTGYPGLGFGETDQNPTSSDNYTKIILRAKCTTLAQYNAWSTIGTTVLTSQDVAQGWLVYFTDITPVILNGQYLQIQPATFNLTSTKTNPANSTFYVYVTVNNGVASYVISATAQAETANNMFIGTIVTGATSITSINMQKVSRIDKYRLSTTSQGSAISVSSGTPNAAGHLNWT